MDKMQFAAIWKNKEIIHCRALKDCSRISEREAFRQGFNKRMAEYGRRMNHKGKGEKDEAQ